MGKQPFLELSYMNFLKLFVTNRISSNKIVMGIRHTLTSSLKVVLPFTCHNTMQNQIFRIYVSACAQFDTLYYKTIKQDLKFI